MNRHLLHSFIGVLLHEHRRAVDDRIAAAGNLRHTAKNLVVTGVRTGSEQQQEGYRRVRNEPPRAVNGHRRSSIFGFWTWARRRSRCTWVDDRELLGGRGGNDRHRRRDAGLAPLRRGAGVAAGAWLSVARLHLAPRASGPLAASHLLRRGP